MEGMKGKNIERRLFIIKNSKLIRYSIFYLPTLEISLGFVVLAFCLFSTLSVESELTTKWKPSNAEEIAFGCHPSLPKRDES